jgi:dTDP-glucose pyrophosphorylase
VGVAFVVFLGDNCGGIPLRQRLWICATRILLHQVDDPTQVGVAVLDAAGAPCDSSRSRKFISTSASWHLHIRNRFFEAVRQIALRPRRARITDTIQKLIDLGTVVHAGCTTLD